VIRNRPTDLSDACWTSPTTKIHEVFGYQLAGTCETLFRPLATRARPPAAASPATR
jgi:hypothetical protein